MKKIILSVLLTGLFLTAAFGQSKAIIGGKSQAEKIDRFVGERMAANHIPGLSLAVVRDGKIVYAKGYGMANLELSVPATEKTVYQLASITKTFTAIATMMLVEANKVSLEDPISKHLSGLPAAWSPVTIRHLLNHTSGISSFAGHKKIPCPVGKDERDYTRADVLKEVACLPLDFAPGERWSYGDTNYHLLGMLIEKVSGTHYERFLRARIFTPLEMRDTRLDSYAELIANRADGYNRSGGGFRNARLLPLFEFANAGLISTVLDMAKLDMALASEKLVQKSTLERMWTNAKLNDGEIVPFYGLGFGLTPYQGRKRVGHSGGGGIGFAASFTRFVDDKVTVIILSNADQEGFTISDMANEIAAFYYSTLTKSVPVRPKVSG